VRTFGRDLVEVKWDDATGTAPATKVWNKVMFVGDIGEGSAAAVALFARCLVCRSDKLDSVIEAMRVAGLLWRKDCFVAGIAFFSIETLEMRKLFPAIPNLIQLSAMGRRSYANENSTKMYIRLWWLPIRQSLI
jgi:hypothetical protein